MTKAAPRAVGQLQSLRIDQGCLRLHELNLAAFAQFQQIFCQRIDDLQSVLPHCVDLDLGGVVVDAPGGNVAHVRDQLGDVQQRLRRNAAGVQAGAARFIAGVDQGDFHPLVGGQKRRRVTAGAGPHDDQFGFNNFRHEVPSPARTWENQEKTQVDDSRGRFPPLLYGRIAASG